jgi:valine--pyruvate aminotransferase
LPALSRDVQSWRIEPISMKYSSFGQRFTRPTGAVELMDDLGAAASRSDVCMLGGGNPARIPEVEAQLRAALGALAADPEEFARSGAGYSAPEGEVRFRGAVAEFLSKRYGWPITEANVALTSGSQTSFFLLFNLFAGKAEDGAERRILLPLSPEYIGYAGLGLGDEIIRTHRPVIEELDDHFFKYRIDFDALDTHSDVAAVCVSRPTNPSGNVLTDDELGHLDTYARDAGVPLIVDAAYGAPFPDVVYSKVTPRWNENIILCLSLSKIGIPGVRTGIVIARPEIVRALGVMVARMSLAPGSIGPVLAQQLLRDGQLASLVTTVIRPYYQERARQAVAWLQELLQDQPYRIHKPEGAFFLWVWFPQLAITSHELYQRLKAKGVYVLSGHYFFHGLEASWPHAHQCLRLTYAQPPEVVRRGLEVLAEEVRHLQVNRR